MTAREETPVNHGVPPGAPRVGALRDQSRRPARLVPPPTSVPTRAVSVDEGSYADLVLLRLEEKCFQADRGVSALVLDVAVRLADAEFSAEAVSRLHVQALRTLTADAGPPRRAALLHAGESVLLEVLGRLADCYRTTRQRTDEVGSAVS